MAKLTKTQLQEAVQAIYSAMVEGDTDADIAARLGLEAEEYNDLKMAMFDAKADEVRSRPTEHTYVQYMIDQAQNVRDLTAMIADFKSSRQYNAMVGAVKVRSEIYDKLIKFGQDFGLIHREAKKGELLVGHLIADMTNKQLKAAITGELSMLNGLVKKYGDRSIMDMEPGSLHHGPRLPAPSVEDSRLLEDAGAERAEPAVIRTKKKDKARTAKAKNNKRHAGRVKVRG
jgi:hypothetical protein